jgi:ribose transport system permease protein
MRATPYGRRVYATGGDRDAAYLSGVPVERIIASTYVWCGGLAGLAGVMLAARLQSGQPTAGEFYELTAIAAVVLGGASLHGGEGMLYKSIIGLFPLSLGIASKGAGHENQRLCLIPNDAPIACRH